MKTKTTECTFCKAKNVSKSHCYSEEGEYYTFKCKCGKKYKVFIECFPYYKDIVEYE